MRALHPAATVGRTWPARATSAASWSRSRRGSSSSSRSAATAWHHHDCEGHAADTCRQLSSSSRVVLMRDMLHVHPSAPRRLPARGGGVTGASHHPGGDWDGRKGKEDAGGPEGGHRHVQPLVFPPALPSLPSTQRTCGPTSTSPTCTTALRQATAGPRVPPTGCPCSPAPASPHVTLSPTP